MKSSKREITRCVSSHRTAIYFATFVRDKHFCISYHYMYKTYCYPLWVFFNLRLIDCIVIVNCGLHFLVTNSMFLYYLFTLEL